MYPLATKNATLLGANGRTVLNCSPYQIKKFRKIEGYMTLERSSAVPLVVDLDGTLTPTDTLVESLICLLKRNPLRLVQLLCLLLSSCSRSEFKHRVSEQSGFTPLHLPFREDFLAWLTSERANGRKIVLATAAHESIANAVSSRIGLFDLVLATDSSNNLKGAAKLAAIKQHVGEHFAYAGDSKADLPIWSAATAAVLVGVADSTSKSVRAMVVVEKEFAYEGPSWRVWLKALRVHQWVKNVLIFVPLCTAFAFNDIQKVSAVVIGFIAFSLAASATYLLNDLWDLGSDRQHPRKKNRPFASAQIPLHIGAAAALILLAVSLAFAFWTSKSFGVMIMGYIVLTTTYSLVLKQYVLIDVIMLAVLYTFRVLAGAVATNISVTPWLLAFCVFTFFSLALAKRCAELVSLNQLAKPGAHGRDYQIGDLVILWPLGVGASLCSVVVFGLYIGTPGAASQYGNTSVLWLVGIGLLYWISRIWIKTARGEMHDDPIIFAVRDFGSRVAVCGMLATVLIAHLLR
jgi:4-hydroxybenzoate polyprenyltransferase